ncbi:phosphoglucosamine mutase [Flavitalea sp. BT771]|uniref:phosphoglucosamine mutase n=1 Tax=Flavitalea sp. BT771 TaxID=3063329 RepID=UPI0026E19BAC|nr:phosphoglucosamine mutase [Flavitalea sp. BT771]MDO6429452.1 phosphoglucosamine mutase [Flavitalea sp. BT771]MDV6218420.1 phosphoglucosamine mutase [Flavitalea sp. BT771]
MTLIKSISGIRGTIGGTPGDNLTPPDIVKFAAAYGSWLKEKNARPVVVIGRDGRISGEMVSTLVIQTLLGLGLDVVDLGLSTTPTVEMAVRWEKAGGGIIITASHNPRQWNALKLLNADGEFISGADGAAVLDKAEKAAFQFATVEKAGTYRQPTGTMEKHIQAILDYPLVDTAAIGSRRFKVVVDGINSTGSLFVPALLKALGVTEVTVLNGEVNGEFAHDPEPLPENLVGLSTEVKRQGADLGIAVDPDVDRLCFVCEDGTLFGEEYTLVAVADYILSRRKGNTVSNMSSTRALKDITTAHGGQYYPSAVGEVNVVTKMKAVNAVIGGEGNGGIIVPDFHYGRDALIGIGLFLSGLAEKKVRMSAYRAQFPNYYMSKNKIALTPGMNIPLLLEKMKERYDGQEVNTEDGLKIEFERGWVHLRGSNTEPIIRVYSEGESEDAARNLAAGVMKEVEEIIR